MKDLTIFLKLNSSSTRMAGTISMVADSLRRGRGFYYPVTSDHDVQTLQDLQNSLESHNLTGCRIVFIVYRTVYHDEAPAGPSRYIQKLYVGTVTEPFRGAEHKINYRVTSQIDSPLVIDNFMAFSNLKLDKDFEDGSYISIENSPALRRQLDYATEVPRNSVPRENPEGTPQEAEEGEEGAPLPFFDPISEFAQKNEYCQRIYGLFPPSTTKSEFQRDYDRIVNCKAFRRMVDKAQIFTSSKGDHYRTRMTHTLCVTQIAREIASRLDMNVPLTEAIALGHDLGHTPFGHQGERTLNELAREKTGKAVCFKHNFQSLNVASVLEEEFIECSGLDLSLQTLEGMWKHTRIRKNPKNPDDPLICELADFLPGDVSGESVSALHPESGFCSTVEGQIVAIADEIAQRSHDLDDALSAGLLDVDKLLEALSLKKLQALKNAIQRLKADIQSATNQQRVFISADELLASRISAEVISYFTEDVVAAFQRFLADGENQEALAQARAYFAEHRCVDRPMIQFSEEGQALNDYLETIVTKQVINSAEVAAFDDRAQRIVSKLFNLYYDNPRLLHEGTLQRVYIKMRRLTNNTIHFQEGDIGLVNEEWTRIKSPERSARLRDLRERFPGRDLSAYEDIPAFLETLEEGSAEYRQVDAYVNGCRREYAEKKKLLVRAICDFISGMTDTYAVNEYRKLVC